MSSKHQTSDEIVTIQSDSQGSNSRTALESLALSLEISPNHPLSDHQIVKMLANVIARDKKELKFLIDERKYIIWDNELHRWEICRENQQFNIIQKAYSTLQRMFWAMKYEKTGKQENPNETVEGESTTTDGFDWNKSALGVAFNKPLSHKRAKDLLDCLSSQQDYAVRRELFDQSATLLPLVSNLGKSLVYDLEFNQLREARREDYILLSPTSRLKDEGKSLLGMLEDKDMKFLRGTKLEKSLSYLFEGREDLRRLAAQVYGYCLRGDNPAQKFFVFYGESRTGKSTITNALQLLFGEMSTTLSAEVITTSKLSNDSKYELGRLEGKRLASVAEPSSGAHLGEWLIKVLTGEARITVREIYGKPKEIEPRAKVICTCNSIPVITDSSGAMHNRLVLLRTYAKTLMNEGEKYHEQIAYHETDEFIAWLILGHRDWRTNGFRGPEECFGRSAEVIRETSDLQGFVSGDMEDTNIWVRVNEKYTERILGNDIYKAYLAWYKESNNRESRMGQRTFLGKFRLMAKAELGEKLPEDSKGGVHFKMVKIMRMGGIV